MTSHRRKKIIRGSVGTAGSLEVAHGALGALRLQEAPAERGKFPDGKSFRYKSCTRVVPKRFWCNLLAQDFGSGPRAAGPPSGRASILKFNYLDLNKFLG